VTHNLLDFNRRVTQPLGILPQFPVTLGGKIVFIDVMVVHDPLDFNFLLGRDYVYAMKVVVSMVFRLMCFPHNGNMVTIDQLSFIGPHMMANHPTSLNGPYMPVTSTPSQVNYVATCPMHSTPNEKESLPSSDLDLVVDMVISSIGILEPDLPTPIMTLDMYSFQSVGFSI
jgi:hypothetical protein